MREQGRSKAIDSREALRRLETLCAKAEHCESELRQKLYRWGIAGSGADEIIDSLRDRRFIDDGRFARAFVRDRFRFAGWGRLKIKAALRMKKLPPTVVDAALEEIAPADYAAMLRALVRRKARGAVGATLAGSEVDSEGSPEDAARERARLYRSLCARGFEPAEVLAAIREC